jgi:hypothetical protein
MLLWAPLNNFNSRVIKCPCMLFDEYDIPMIADNTEPYGIIYVGY